MRKLLLAAAISASALAGASGTASAVPTNLVTNGSFESFSNGVFTGWINSGSLGVTPSQYAVPHPTNGTTPGPYGDVVPQDTFSFSPDPAGVQGAYFVADQAIPFQALSQTIALTVGTTYEVGFDLYATNSGAANSGPFTLVGSIGNTVITTATNSSPGVWRHYSATFVAQNASEVFSFAFSSGAAPAKDVIADLVYVGTPLTPVPEPASLMVLGMGLAGLGVLRRRQRS